MIPNTQFAPSSAIFVDVPNLVNREDGQRVLRWNVLSEHVATHCLEGTELTHAGAYVVRRKDVLTPQLQASLHDLAETGFTPVIRAGKDIDSWIMNDMWQAVAAHEQRSIANGNLWYPLQIRFVLISGDGGFTRALESIKSTYQKNLELDIVVYSWEGALHGHLRTQARQVYLLDELPDFVHEEA